MARETLDSICAKAQSALSQGEFELARAYFEKALRVRPDHADAHHGLATVYFLTNDLEASAHHFREATRFDPMKAGAFINLGAVYNRLERYDEAITTLRRGIALDHNRAEGYYNLGLVYRKLGQLDMAVQAYREATRVNPRMADAHYNIANIYLERGQTTQAVTHYRQALEVRPNWEKALRGLEHAEQILDEEEFQEVEASTRTSLGSDVGPQVTAAPATGPKDPDRVVDPHDHADLLRSLHRAVVDADGVARNLLQSLQGEVECAIKELSTTLLYPTSRLAEVIEHTKKFEQALAHLRELDDTVQNSMERIRMLGEQLVRS